MALIWHLSMHGRVTRTWEGSRERRTRVPFLPDVTFIIRLEIIFPLVRGGPVHIYPLLMFRFGVGLIFNHQIYIFSVVYKYRSVLHGEDVDESFI